MKGPFGFVTAFFADKADQGGMAAVSLLARLDPKTASRAELAQIREALQEVIRRTELAKQSRDKEQREADVVTQEWETQAGVIRKLQTILADPEKAGKHAQANESLGREMEKARALKPKYLKERGEAERAAKLLSDLERLCELRQQGLNEAEDNLARGQAAVEQAQAPLDLERDQKETRAMLDRLGDFSATGIASQSYAQQAAEMELEAGVLRRERELDAKSHAPAPDDDLVAEIKQEMAGGPKTLDTEIDDLLRV